MGTALSRPDIWEWKENHSELQLQLSFSDEEHSERGKLPLLVLPVGVLRFDMREQRRLVQEDLRTVDALQVGPVGQLRVSGQDVFLQLVRLAERLLAVIAHVQVLVQVHVSARPLLPAVLLAPQRQMLSVLTVSLQGPNILTHSSISFGGQLDMHRPNINICISTDAVVFRNGIGHY